MSIAPKCRGATMKFELSSSANRLKIYKNFGAKGNEKTEGRRSNPVEQKPRQPPSGLSRLLHSHGGKKP
ncbi:MAG: hypothetical protein A3D22_07610 [Deltaproteobacteria bacterium RIFCSPHIGHO2_02_FULL_44_53]|nr:MAG: hypothetical protein A3D22_07610 [Deltaproteobacteria bacterium RIFCSPHIGHO2_02_FULL_44_53]